MDANPWTYQVMAQEIAREGKLESPASPDTPALSDQRNYLYAEVTKTTTYPVAPAPGSWVGVALAVQLRGSERWFSPTTTCPTGRSSATTRRRRRSSCRRGRRRPPSRRSGPSRSRSAPRRAHPRPTTESRSPRCAEASCCAATSCPASRSWTGPATSRSARRHQPQCSGGRPRPNLDIRAGRARRPRRQQAQRAAVGEVFGPVPVQRCVRHKERGVLDHLPERDQVAVKLRAGPGQRVSPATRRAQPPWPAPTRALTERVALGRAAQLANHRRRARHHHSDGAWEPPRANGAVCDRAASRARRCPRHPALAARPIRVAWRPVARHRQRESLLR